jgi:eIF-2B alpha/beta/delta-like uncharacterized protein
MVLDSQIADLARDNVSGAQDITRRAASLVCRLTEERELPLEELKGAVLGAGVTLLHAQPAMASLFNMFSVILHDLDKAPSRPAATRAVLRASRTFLVEMEDHNRKISGLLYDLLGEGRVILTHSASQSTREALTHCWRNGKRFSVICTESRPVCEGVLLAGALVNEGIPTTLITDALSFSLLKERVDLILVGADSVSLQGVINKAGTLGLAMAAGSCSIPFYVLAGTEKFLPSTVSTEQAIQEKPPEEILPSSPEGLKIINRYFDITPLAYLTAVVTELGILTPQKLTEQLEKLAPHQKLIAELGKTS